VLIELSRRDSKKSQIVVSGGAQKGFRYQYGGHEPLRSRDACASHQVDQHDATNSYSDLNSSPADRMVLDSFVRRDTSPQSFTCFRIDQQTLHLDTTRQPPAHTER
jgi:hypothetical protein